MTPTRRRTSIAAAALAPLLAVTLSACGGAPAEEAAAPVDEQPSSAPGASAAATTHNEADVQFSQMMIVHHQGALEMAELAVEKADSEEVRALGERIAAAQGPEIETMTSWLQAWGQDMDAEMDMGGMDGMGMEDMEGMEGMDQETAMDELAQLSGTDFDRRFLELMTEHHRGAIEMAEEHHEQGQDPEVLRLSGDIIDAQTAEITEMTNLLLNL